MANPDLDERRAEVELELLQWQVAGAPVVRDRMDLEYRKLEVEIAKLEAETAKLDRERFLYLLVIGTGVIAALLTGLSLIIRVL